MQLRQNSLPASFLWRRWAKGSFRKGFIYLLSHRRFGARFILALLLFDAFLPIAASAQTELPRYASLRADRVNVRSGPGVRYPIVWVFVRRGLPIQITAEFEFWRKIRDRDSSEGWVHQNLISGTRMALVIGAVRPLHDGPSATTPILLFAEPGVQGELMACHQSWCEARIAGRSGWIQRDHLWGVGTKENFE
jgi:SH3-like domain-containing protein